MWIVILLPFAGILLDAGLSVADTGAPAELVYLCRHPDGVARQGETVCLDIQGRRQLARCAMVLNNASWQLLGADCDPEPPKQDLAPAPAP